MRPYALFAILIASALVFTLAPVARADDPPKPTDVHPEATSPPPPRGDFDPMPIQSGELTLDPSTASITRLELAEDNKSLIPAAPSVQNTAPATGNVAPRSLVLDRFDGSTLYIAPNSAAEANDALLNQPRRDGPDGQQINAASSTIITSQDFEGDFPPPGSLWQRADGNGASAGEYLWDDVPCYPQEEMGGIRSAWPGDNGANGLQLGTSDCGTVTYPDSMDSWLVYGPFSLVGARSASLDFYFRIISQSCDPIDDCDFLFWGASTNAAQFRGDFAAGTYTSGPFNNGHNFASLDLSYLAGEPNVWIAIVFASNNDGVRNQGPFIDNITLRKNTDARTYLTDENFDSIDFPNQQWESFDADGAANGDSRWDDVRCFSRTGEYAMWPADNGPNRVDVCAGGQYPNNAWTWLLHGPLNLSGASEAWIDFYFRNDSELFVDEFFSGVSIDGIQYYGTGFTGDFTSGPHTNGYNLWRLDLKDVPPLGDLRGQSNVWLAFVFESDFSITGQGPFVDDVSVVVERPAGSKTLLPLVLKPPAQPTTNLSIKNETTDSVSYTVKIPQGNVTCSGIPAGATRPCGTFASGTYPVTVTSQECGTNSGEVYFAPGPVTRVVRCVSPGD
jgi:hypothetical protein